MRGTFLAILGISAATLLATAADSGPPSPVKPGITFPVVPVPPAPAPAPSPSPTPAPVLPGAVQTLAADTLYVVASDDQFLLFVSPDDKAAPLVTVVRESGPLKIRGKFIDGKGGVETRTYTAKHLAIVEAVPGAAGRVALIAFPAGAKDESAAVRQRIDVNQGAKPPPVDPPKPVPPDVTPDPKPEPKPVVTGDLWVIVVEELDDRTVATAKIVNDSAFWLDQAKRGVKLRTYDKDESAAVNKGYVREAGKVGLPAVLLLDADGDVVKAKAMPKDLAGMKAIIAEVR